MKLELKDAFIDGWIEEGLEKGGAEGRLDSARQMTLRLLEKRFSVPEDIRKRVEECTDVAEIDAWFGRAITAKSLDEVFAES
jgi:hypothetical protein